MWQDGQLEVAPVIDVGGSPVAGYRWYRDNEPTPFAETIIPQVREVSVPVDGTYRFSVSAFDAGGLESAKGPALSVDLDHVAPPIPGAPQLMRSFTWVE